MAVRLTERQLWILLDVLVCSNRLDHPNGVRRSLVIRGLLDRDHQLTERGWTVLMRDLRLSPEFRATLRAIGESNAESKA